MTRQMVRVGFTSQEAQFGLFVLRDELDVESKLVLDLIQIRTPVSGLAKDFGRNASDFLWLEPVRQSNIAVGFQDRNA